MAEGRTPARVTTLLTYAAFGIAAVGTMALLGIPGAAWLMLARPIARLFTAVHAPADSGWPMALQQSLIWPAFLPLAYRLAVRWAAPGRRRVALTLLLTASASLALAVGFQASSGLV